MQALFAEVTKARERLAKVPLILKRFGQSVLAAACSGRLTTSTKTGTEEWEVVEMQTLFLNSPQNGLYKSSDLKSQTLGLRSWILRAYIRVIVLTFLDAENSVWAKPKLTSID